MQKVDNYSNHSPPLITKDECHSYLDCEVVITLKDHNVVRAIIINVDDHNITVLIRHHNSREQQMFRHTDERIYRPRYPNYRYRRLLLPLVSIAALSLLPYATYPYSYYPPYPFY